MPKTTQSKLADALDRVRASSRKQVIKSSDLRRLDRELLIERGYLIEILKGWYLLGRPADNPGESTAWYAAFWDFIAVYLEDRFGSDYCLSAASSIDIQIGANAIPLQVIAMTGHGGKTMLGLPHATSLLVYEDQKNLPQSVELVRGLRAMPLALALCRIPPSFFENQPINAEIALRAVKSVDDLSRVILVSESPTAAGRFVGAYRFLGESDKAEQISSTMQSAGIHFEPRNPFTQREPVLSSGLRLVSPYAGRIEALFGIQRKHVLDVFSEIETKPVTSIEECLRQVESIYEHDAYNSLSIEGYQVTPELIERIRSGEWNPIGDPRDQHQVAAMAAKGYLTAFHLVEKSVARTLQGENPGSVVRQDYREWYRALFSESVRGGLLQAYHLAGHRNAPVYIRSSRHAPPPPEAVNDSITRLFDLLEAEPHAIVRAVLGHWLFGFIHPYMDGNGRIARFLMNVMMASGGYPWTIVRMSRRKEYLDGLEIASTEASVRPFAQFIREEMNVNWANQPKR